ncbi:uncharacterized protein LOC133501857 [Syngnathoides biaculeatus]|uniref:uncharacterized protein LOC133501857 n=1 Tax=Syngnathoides biaculeatus TaxID=300417 RepID=UPI002ADD9E63|nr:uncharacterized protein LOC133501857 [Syngnathoides biaculeatus]XP_061677935.1 uncharacterized protein LOC133501857 [Syngnathoides biaculeatus]
MAQARVKTRVYWEIKFPDIPHCTRRRRAWYDTLLGGMGTLYGVANAADNEVTRTMLSNTGQHASEAIHQVGVWLPKAMIGQLENTGVWKKAFTWELKLWNETYDALKNLSHMGNWTTCALQMIHAEAQKKRFQRIMTTGNYHEWRRVWNICSKLWLQLHSERTKCNSTYCAGYWTQYNVSTVKTICKYQVLPMITTTGFWFLHLDGEWMDVGTNTTYKMKMCDETDRGMACILQQGHSNPCLTDSEAVLCDWTREPRREMLWQIGPHALCVATMQNNSQVPSVPFVGCLYNVHLWHWGNQTYRLTNYSVQWDVLKNPWNLSLERFKCALEQHPLKFRKLYSHIRLTSLSSWCPH